MRAYGDSAKAIKLKLLACALVPFLVASGVAINQETVANEMDANFDSEFMRIYGLDGDDFFWLGEDGLVGRWLSDDQVKVKDCEVFDSCNFLEVATIEGCYFGFSLKFLLYDSQERVIGHGRALGGVMRPGDLVTVEIGAKESVSFDYLEPETAECLAKGIPA